MRFNVTIGDRKLHLMLRALFFLLIGTATLACATEVKSVRVAARNDYTRATIDLSDAPDYQIFTLANPDRLVVDVKRGSLRNSIDGDGRGLVKSVRSGLVGLGPSVFAGNMTCTRY